VNLSDEYFRKQLTTVFDPFRQERTTVLQTSANRVLDSFAIESPHVRCCTHPNGSASSGRRASQALQLVEERGEWGSP